MTEIEFIVIYLVIMALVIEIATMLFVTTGLKKQIARYQVISMLTATGFTTDEATLIIDHPIRRKISAAVILFGYFSLAVMISSIASLLSNDLRINWLIAVAGSLFVALLLLKSKGIKSFLTAKFEREMDEEYDLEDWSLKAALSLGENDMVALIDIEEDSKYLGQPAQELIMEDADLHLLFIRRGSVILRKSLFEVQLQAGDKVMIFGEKDHIEKDFEDMLSDDKK
ncbi:TrkA C-terminal domain-containing protein [Planococcus sp. N028]|uniref:TrkA C-terminal domain-containing protein n=1 Tax=Planococcus shixiaomingii TaxID=3058393 RepID=A0ABT8N2D0_9BACL|nr:TrkA C-terminal domain-containing protein [Planococcus sp. N028]MDN7242035.1 TrkA C-terminal domain-containing protein [Planococcus sp. N028]